MRLKRLVISGFKSFADKTSFEFEVPLTAIVGPNGCGKSNIVDAFKWVMGEQSAKSIRGDKMLDIIFSGTEKRKPQNVAEVTLVFSNEEGILPIGYQEVAITRRVYRSGESEYLINKNQVRLKDIESLFWDTGLGKDAFCIFEQGKIDQVINDTPLERRSIFEEASGVLRFKQRRKETLRRLEVIGANLLRAQDIHQMVLKHKESLEKQAREAKIFDEKQKRLTSLSKHLLFSRWEIAIAKVKTRQESHANFLAIEKEIQTECHELNQRLEIEKRQFLDKESDCKVTTQSFFEKKNLKNLKVQERESLAVQKKELQERFHSIEDKLTELKEKKERTLQQFLQNQKETFVSEGDFIVIEKDLKEKQQSEWQKRKQLSELKNEQKILQEERLRLASGESGLKGKLQEIKLRLKTAEERDNYLKQDLSRYQKQKEELLATEKERRSVFEKLSLEVGEKQRELARLDENLSHSSKELREQQDKEREAQTKVGELLAKKKILGNLKLEFEGVSRGSKRLLQAAMQPKNEIYGLIKPLYELIKPKKGLEVSLKLYEDTLVVSSEEILSKVIAYAKKEKIAGFSLFCSNSKDLSIHFFQDPRVFIEEGIFKDRLGVIFFPDSSEKSLFLRESELQRLQEELTCLMQEQANWAFKVKEYTLSIEEQRVKRFELDKLLRQLEMKLVEVNFGLQRAIADCKKTLELYLKCESEVDLLKVNAHTASKELITWVEKEEELAKEISERSKHFEVLENEVKTCEKTLQNEELVLRECEVKYKKFHEIRYRHRQLEELFEATNKGHITHEKQLHEEKQSLEEKEKSLSEKGKMIEKELNILEKELLFSQKVLVAKKEEAQQISLKISEIEENLNRTREKLKNSEAKTHSLHLELVQEEAIAKALFEEAQVDFGINIIELKQEEEASLPLIQKEISVLKEELAALGNVNLGAIEEFERQKEQESILRVQLDDLVASKEELLQIIDRLDLESRKLFLESFQKIRVNFKKNFQLLFQGGDANLVFVESDDPLLAGIEIEVCPPGKQMRSITLLSGGEKCLTSLALLFAIFEVKPSAFCLLDEVDAPLDEVNVEKYTRMLQQFAKSVQFVVITHNKRTMSAADALLGISMEEKGISKLISLTFQREEVLC